MRIEWKQHGNCQSGTWLRTILPLVKGVLLFLENLSMFVVLSILCCFADCKSNTWGVRLGQMLVAAKKQDSEAFYEKLKIVRKEQVVPLSAASFECGTYQRGYEYIVR